MHCVVLPRSNECSASARRAPTTNAPAAVAPDHCEESAPAVELRHLVADPAIRRVVRTDLVEQSTQREEHDAPLPRRRSGSGTTADNGALRRDDCDAYAPASPNNATPAIDIATIGSMPARRATPRRWRGSTRSPRAARSCRSCRTSRWPASSPSSARRRRLGRPRRARATASASMPPKRVRPSPDHRAPRRIPSPRRRSNEGCGERGSGAIQDPERLMPLHGWRRGDVSCGRVRGERPDGLAGSVNATTAPVTNPRHPVLRSSDMEPRTALRRPHAWEC